MVQNTFFKVIHQLKANWQIVLIIILSAFFRLYNIADYMEFLGDQGRDVVIARDFLVNGNLFFIGPQTSVGNMYLGPFYYYLIVVPGLALFNQSPIGPSVLVALLGILTTILIFKYTKNWYGKEVGLIASLFYSISPVAIKYSNFSWNPNIMPLFSLLFFYFVSTKKYIPASIAFIICLNSHFLSLLLLPLGGAYWIYNYFFSQDSRPSQIKHTIIAIIIFLFSLTPQILFDIKHNGQNIKALTSFFTQRESTVNLKPYKAIPYVVPLFNQINTRLLSGKNLNFGYMVSFIFIISLGYSLIKDRSKNVSITYFLCLWLIVGLTGLALYKQHIYDHYFGFLFPVIFILFAYSISKLSHIFKMLIIIAIIGFSLLENPFRWAGPKQLESTTQITNSIIIESNGRPFNFALLAKMNYDPGYRYFFSKQNADVKLLSNQITDQLFVVCEPFQIDCNPINNPFWDVAAFGWAKVDKEWSYNEIKIFKLSHTKTDK